MILVSAAGSTASAQTLGLTELRQLVNYSPEQIDSLLAIKKFYPAPQEADSTLQLHYYSYKDSSITGEQQLRSFSYAEVTLGEQRGRLIRYRTYDRTEYERLLASLLQEGYRTLRQFQLGNEQHTLYTDDHFPLRLIIGKVRFPDRRKVEYYELEAGN
ncbi:MAG: hypothetical protein ACKO6K_10695 [Chitinophagaceae bacterium]